MTRRPDRIVLAALAALASLAALSACHDLPDLGTCGNGVTEEANGEACDDSGESARCTATCELKCRDEGAAADYVEVESRVPNTRRFCPDATYACGVDDVCRAPSGAFTHGGTALPFDVSGPLQLADVDNDGLLDLVGTSATNIYVRFSRATGTPLGDLLVVDGPSSEAPFTVADMNPRGSGPMGQPDVLVAVPTEGIALLESDTTTLLPKIELQIPFNGETNGLVIRDPDPQLGEVVITVASTSTTSTIAVQRPTTAPPEAPTAGVPPLDLPACVGMAGPGGWNLVDVETTPDRRSFVVVTQHTSGTPAWHVCHYTQAGTIWTRTDFEVPGAAPASAALANIDADPGLELVVGGTAAQGGVRMLDAAGPTCSFTPAPVTLPIVGMPGPVLAAGQVVPGGVDELVLATGVYRQCAGAECAGNPLTFVSVASPTKVPWRAAAVVDLNRDGVVDVAAARAGEPDLDVVRGGAVLNVYRANTSEPVSALVAGDFDGDRIGDVALVETTPMSDRVSVLFGTLEATVAAPVPMTPLIGRLRVDRASELRWLPSTRGYDGVDDIVVVATDGTGSRAGLLVGDAARVMTTQRFPPDATGVALSVVAAGPFTQSNTELLAISPMQARLYRVPSGNVPTAQDWSKAMTVPAVITPPLAVLHAENGRARAVARTGGAMAHEVLSFTVENGTMMDEYKIAACPKTTIAGLPSQMYPIDVDGDGIDEVAVLSQDMNSQPPVTPTLQIFDAHCPSKEVVPGTLRGCMAITKVGGRLMALCSSRKGAGLRGLFEVDGKTLALGEEIVTLDLEGRFLATGDFDGDGVLDIAAGVNRAGVIHVELVRQCPAHDTRACPNRPTPPGQI